MRLGLNTENRFQEFQSEACRGMHGHIERDQPRFPHGLFVQELSR